MPPNTFLLAADNSPQLLPLLRSDPPLARQQDDHGYSLVHAAASYNHLDLLRALVGELRVPVDLRDEDAETALFVVETVDAARCLVEELGLDIHLRGADGQTAREKIEADGDFPAVAEYLKGLEGGRQNGVDAVHNEHGPNGGEAALTELPPPPEGMSVTVGTMAEPEVVTEQPDPEFRQRIEQLAARDDFHTPEAQLELRKLVEDAITDGGIGDERNVRPRHD